MNLDNDVVMDHNAAKSNVHPGGALHFSAHGKFPVCGVCVIQRGSCKLDSSPPTQSRVTVNSGPILRATKSTREAEESGSD